MGLLERIQGRRVYLDANVFIYALNAFPPFADVLESLFAGIDSGEVRAASSELTATELLVIPFRHADIEEERRCRMALRPRPGLDLIPVCMHVLEEAARLRADRPALRTPDAIHLATARRSDCPVFLTNDLRIAASSGMEVLFLSEWAEAEKER